MATADATANRSSQHESDASSVGTDSVIATPMGHSDGPGEKLHREDIVLGQKEDMPEDNYNSEKDIIGAPHRECIAGEENHQTKDPLSDNGSSVLSNNSGPDIIGLPHTDTVAARDGACAESTRNCVDNDSSNNGGINSSNTNDKAQENTSDRCHSNGGQENNGGGNETYSESNGNCNTVDSSGKDSQNGDANLSEGGDEGSSNAAQKASTEPSKNNVFSNNEETEGDNNLEDEQCQNNNKEGSHSKEPDVVTLPHREHLSGTENERKDPLTEQVPSVLSNSTEVDIVGLSHTEVVAGREDTPVKKERSTSKREDTKQERETPVDSTSKSEDTQKNNKSDCEKYGNDPNIDTPKGKEPTRSLKKKTDDTDTVALPHKEYLEGQEGGYHDPVAATGSLDAISDVNNSPYALSNYGQDDILHAPHSDGVASADADTDAIKRVQSANTENIRDNTIEESHKEPKGSDSPKKQIQKSKNVKGDRKEPVQNKEKQKHSISSDKKQDTIQAKGKHRQSTETVVPASEKVNNGDAGSNALVDEKQNDKPLKTDTPRTLAPDNKGNTPRNKESEPSSPAKAKTEPEGNEAPTKQGKAMPGRENKPTKAISPKKENKDISSNPEHATVENGAEPQNEKHDEFKHLDEKTVIKAFMGKGIDTDPNIDEQNNVEDSPNSDVKSSEEAENHVDSKDKQPENANDGNNTDADDEFWEDKEINKQYKNKRKVDLDSVSWSTWPAVDRDSVAPGDAIDKADYKNGDNSDHDGDSHSIRIPAEYDPIYGSDDEDDQGDMAPSDTKDKKSPKKTSPRKTKAKYTRKPPISEKAKAPFPPAKAKKGSPRRKDKNARSSSLPPGNTPREVTPRQTNSSLENSKSDNAKGSDSQRNRLPKINSTNGVSNNKQKGNPKASKKLVLPLINGQRSKNDHVMDSNATQPPKKAENKWKPPARPKKDLPVWWAPPDVHYPRRKHPLAPRRDVGASDPEVIENRAAWPQFKVKWPDKDIKHYSDEEDEL